MNTFQFITSLAWALMALFALGFVSYLVLSGRLKWVQYDTVVGKVGLQIASALGMKGLTADEILAFESFVYRDLQHMERGARLAYILLFLEKELLVAHFEDNTLQIELTEKGKQLHLKIIEECEKKLMMTPNTEIKWRKGEKKELSKAEEQEIAHHEQAISSAH